MELTVIAYNLLQLIYYLTFSATGFVLDSHHFFTFDNRHVTFKGSCSYVLAQDLVDGNFSVVISLESGSLKSIAIINKGATLEILADKSVSIV